MEVFIDPVTFDFLYFSQREDLLNSHNMIVTKDFQRIEKLAALFSKAGKDLVIIGPKGSCKSTFVQYLDQTNDVLVLPNAKFIRFKYMRELLLKTASRAQAIMIDDCNMDSIPF
jgi:ABC-type histidine transport system ATPase subunit